MKMLRTLRKLLFEMVATSSRKAAASIILLVTLSFTEGVGLLLLIPLLGSVGVEDRTTMPRAAGWLDSILGEVGLKPTLGTVLALFVGIAGVRALLQRWQARLSAAVREDFTSAMRVRVYRAIAGAEWRFLVTRRASAFAHALTGEIGRIGTAASQIIDTTVLVAVSTVYLALAFHLSPVMAALVLSCAIALAWAVRGALDQARKLGGRASVARADLHAAIAEHIGSMKTAKSYGASARHADIFTRLSHDVRNVTLEVAEGETTLQQRLEFGSTTLLALIVYVSFETLGVPTAQLLVLLFIFARLMPRFVAVYRHAQSLASALPVLDGIDTLERECLDAAEPVAADNGEKVALARRLRFEHVSFTYPRRAFAPALRDLDLEITAGLTTAIVGPSGAGKTTLADLLIGLLHPTTGRILVDGEPLDAKRLAGWRRQLSYVPQETFLFHDTVRANLVWASPMATDDDVWRALRLAAAEEFVTALPQGLDTVVGERGVLVSGGERQRLSLARALLRQPRMLVLDEATSSLDSENELRIQHAIHGLHRQLTIVVITHRLSTIREADLIHVLDRGRLVESGTWDALWARGSGRFRELCAAQGLDRRPSRTGRSRPVGGRHSDSSMNGVTAL